MIPDSISEDKTIGAAVADSLAQNASIKNLFGEPIETQGKTIITVAQIAMGLGGGYGQGRKAEDADGEGAGAGGGVYAVPKGIFEITEKTTRFVPVTSPQTFLLGTALGLAIGWLFSRRRK
ncbi:spore germination protein GerW family protein [Rufibacter latericius]|uniref:Sporulation protein n=1 Tax=Rufibacter latericius TaxID=2487040 RepID=A0A3M9MQH0_9BACT|nr:spore germination protein GerW family protein [Rufibacter latericius]RNI26948.1 hypothetical protein EFB08_10800 [Rufibacter latericius]